MVMVGDADEGGVDDDVECISGVWDSIKREREKKETRKSFKWMIYTF